jgi:uncharacterized protein
MSKYKPGSREDDTWFSDEQLEKLAPADDTPEHLRYPVPTQMVSNGEYMPAPQTNQQKQVEGRMNELVDLATKKLGVSRRAFLGSSGGMAASFLAMNDVFGKFFNVSKEEMFEPAAYASNSTPPNLFVVDDQLHIIRSSQGGHGSALRDIAAGRHSSNNPGDLPDELNRVNYPWNPLMASDPNWRSSWHLPNFIKWVYLDSQVTVGVLTNNNSAAIPGEGGSRPPKNVTESEGAEGLTAAQTMAARNFINKVAGSRRALGHGQLYTGIGNLDFMRYQAEVLKPDTWKGYNIATAAKVDKDPNSDMRRWRLDDEAVAYPTYSIIDSYATKETLRDYPGYRTLCVHKGLSTALEAGGATHGADGAPEFGYPSDIPKAASDWPQFNFVIYHACIRPGFWVLPALNDIRSGVLRNGPKLGDVGVGIPGGVPDILWSTRFAYLSAPFRNVFAEIGTTWASSVVTFPSVAAHLLGQFMKIMGPDRIVFGSDSVHYGAPQWQIDALWRFQIPDEMRAKWGYPALDEAAKRKILGLNSARIYRLPSASEASPQGAYKPVPQNYQDLLYADQETKRIMEFPAGWQPCFVPGQDNTCPSNPFSQDNFSKMKQMYSEAGGKPDHVRFGWLRKRI